MIVNQWVPALHAGDAIGDSTRRMRDALRKAGHQSDIFAMTIDDDVAGEARPVADPAACPGDVTLFHFALPSPMSAGFARLPGRRLLIYHNITPARFLAPFDAGLARLAAIGRRELAGLAAATDLGLGDSEFNRRELERLGFARTGVLPIAVDFDRLDRGGARPALEATLAEDDLPTVLFVGRVAPNKRLEDHIKLAEYYKRYVSEEYRFVFVGRTGEVPRYFDALVAMVREYKFPPGRIVFTGHVSDDELAACYRSASIYLSLSEHEGFSVPLVEAMHAGVPILAYRAAAVPDTLGDAGVQFAPKDFEHTAELLGELIDNGALRAQVIAGQRARVKAFAPEAVAKTLLRYVEG